MRSRRFAIEPYTTGSMIKETRKKMGLTQREFAQFVNVSKPTVERWEMSEDKITGPIVTVLAMIMREGELPAKMELPASTYPLRLFYMYENTVCTVIDVDEIGRRVLIHNYCDNLLMRAFGRNIEPSFEEYEDFLRSRCFPESRDKVKLELARLNIPFYDPTLIIEKTQGRMADDRFWIRIEKVKDHG